MERLCSVVGTLLSDEVVFPLFESLFLALFLYALAKERGWFTKPRGITLRVQRGEKSWGYFNLAYGIASIVLLQVINVAKAFEGYKTFISLVDLFMLTYLAFYNSWFRNAIIGIISRSQQKWER